MALKRLTFRAMRGQAFTHFFDIPEQEADDSICSFKDKLVFIIIYHEGDYVYRRLHKICETFSSDPM
jgi:V-type ATPase 116kDa subunit family